MYVFVVVVVVVVVGCWLLVVVVVVVVVVVFVCCCCCFCMFLLLLLLLLLRSQHSYRRIPFANYVCASSLKRRPAGFTLVASSLASGSPACKPEKFNLGSRLQEQNDWKTCAFLAPFELSNCNFQLPPGLNTPELILYRTVTTIVLHDPR